MRWLIRILMGGLSLFLVAIFPSQAIAGSFSAERAYEHIQHLANNVGARPSGSEGEEKAAKYLYYVLQKYGWKVKEQPFSKIVVDSNPLKPGPKTIRMINSRNVVAELPGAIPDTIIIGAHYDSAGADVPGAIDNASGVGTVLELARILAQEEHTMTYQIVFFGAEELGLVGSNYFVKNTDLSAVNWMLNIDMVGDPVELDIAGAKSASPELLQAVSNIARKQELSYHLSRDLAVLTRESSQGGSSDFSPFLDQGISAVGLGIAGRPAGYFHRPEDQIDQISLASLQKVGDYVEELVKTIKLERSGPQIWDELYIPFKINNIVLIVPSWVLRLLVLLTIGLVIVILSFHGKKKPEEPWKIYALAPIIAGGIGLIAVILCSMGELLWQTIKGITLVWQAFPGIFLAYRLIVFVAVIGTASILVARSPIGRVPRAYWLVGYISLIAALILIALVRVDLSMPIVFWLIIYSVLLFYPNPLLVFLGPFFVYTFHWELFNSQQWQSYYQFLHQYSTVFIITYSMLAIPLVLSLIYVVINNRKLNISKKYLTVTLSALGIATLILGLVPGYTGAYPQILTVTESYNNQGESRILISSPDNLPQKLLSNFNVENSSNLKEISVANLSGTPPVSLQAAVVYIEPRIKNLALRLDYDDEPHQISLRFESTKPFTIRSLKNFLPLDKLPKNVELKGQKSGDQYTITIERFPPHHKDINISIEADAIIKCSVRCTIPNDNPKLVLNSDRISTTYQSVYESKIEF